jgi:hypothetical protein
MDPDRRQNDRRRQLERREQASARTDVMRIEHENLYNQVMENVRALRRIEGELSLIRSMVEQRERDRAKDASVA